MSRHFNQKIAPKRGNRYRVLFICRISTPNQDERSLEDQQAFYREYLDREIGSDYDVEIIQSQASGELLDREELAVISEKVDSGDFDVVVCEDLSRIARHIIAYQICEDAEDSFTRLIAINDHVDTFDEDWRTSAFFATMRHERYNEGTSHRIKRSLRSRFRAGSLSLSLLAGYVRPRKDAPDDECRKDSEAEAIYDEWFARLEDEESFAQIARWLNEIGFATGPCTNKNRWDGTLVGQTTRNPLLKGQRRWNERTSRRVNRTGRRQSVEAPDDMLLTREVPHLAFIEPERYDRVIRMLAERNAPYGKGIRDANRENGGRRTRGTRNDSQWPSQHIRCGVCGRRLVLGGHGRTGRLMCDGARSYQCFNAMSVDVASLAAGVTTEVIRLLRSGGRFDDDLIEQIRLEAASAADDNQRQIAALGREASRVDREVTNLTQAIAEGVDATSVCERLRAAEQERARIEDQLCRIRQSSAAQPVLPEKGELLRIAEQAISELAAESFEFGQAMRRLLPDFEAGDPTKSSRSRAVSRTPRCVSRSRPTRGGRRARRIARSLAPPHQRDASCDSGNGSCGYARQMIRLPPQSG